MSEVFFLPASTAAGPYSVGQKVARIFAALQLTPGLRRRSLVALKVQVGERGRPAPLPPAWVQPLARQLADAGMLPFFTDTCALQRGHLSNGVLHARAAHDRGFEPVSAGAPYLVADGLAGEAAVRVPVPGRNGRSATVAQLAVRADALVTVAHVTGHLQSGLGGVLMALGHGLASRAGKLDQSEALRPRVDTPMCAGCGVCLEICNFDAIRLEGGRAVIDQARCTGCGQCMTVCYMEGIRPDIARGSPVFQERVAEHAAAVLRGKEGRTGHLALLMRVTNHADSVGRSERPLFPDIGVLAATDPVALDQAVLDLVARETGRPLTAWTDRQPDPEPLLAHAEALGVGSRSYRLAQLPAD
ncbi:MAG: DUF362 domain-containing protein [Candidatus Krumholzibacteriia bacterium]